MNSQKNKEMQTALVIGATGMVGTQLIQQLIATTDNTKIISLVRRASGVKHPKLEEHVIDFDQPESWADFVKGDVLFSCLGTTLAKAQSKEAQYKVDFTYQYIVAQVAAQNKVPKYVLVSSAGANANSSNFYIRTKGELDEAVRKLPFSTINILRPGQLVGERNENRLGEKIGLKVMYALNKMGLFKRYRPIEACQVARAMLLVASKDNSGINTLNELFEIK